MKQLLACALLVLALPVHPAASTSEPFAWVGLQDALDQAPKVDKLIVVDVFTDWCGWCKKLDQDVYSREDIQSYLKENFFAVKLDAEDRKTTIIIAGTVLTPVQIAAAYGVSSYPTTLFLLPDGKLIYGLRGYHPPDRFLQALQYFGEGRYMDDLPPDEKTPPSDEKAGE